ncbi:MAG: hypothetical protein MK078_10520, partial [Crocinitomicaceae bacterium]|nr:hypothetical protein [Crocinitomicaceae bacterium]
MDWAIDETGGGLATEQITDVFVDSVGNTYVCGFFNEDVTFGSTFYSIGALEEAFVYKTDPDGNILWVVRSFGLDGVAHANTLYVDEAGAVYVGGYYTHSDMSWGGLTVLQVNGEDFFLVKIDKDGNPIN